MPIHHIDPSDQSSLLDIYATRASQDCLPKYRLPKGRTEPRAAYALIRDELLLDGNARQNLATFCTTWVEDEVKQLMTEAIDKNMIDKDEYPQTAEIENRCVHILADLWHAEQSQKTVGCSTTGSSEAAMLGGLAFKWAWRKRREALRPVGTGAHGRLADRFLSVAHEPLGNCGPAHLDSPRR
ncbi:pyridoxal-dependent decarboxylase [Actimicrobium sp. CCI2.3]|uniref:pyridoxal-dependent decarboxylase n=1 Tax=Actimicrobium sp. CCI2.3 TaxID=3048616 RepID=UPI002AB4D29F|nr:pyridoxal-dependent decarboxylase [Actimicrobium sp. CCI2.3]MDY7572692.1 pyridoxal-dependent decarboxylase [Actimicrobium sp. CCI2.3]